MIQKFVHYENKEKFCEILNKFLIERNRLFSGVFYCTTSVSCDLENYILLFDVYFIE